MLLSDLRSHDFRNTNGEIGLTNGLNILIGDNGQGKTNWLEAISILATTRSFRTSKLQEAVRFEGARAVIEGKVQVSGEITRELRVLIENNVKQFALNGKRESVQNYLGQLHTVLFNADAIEVVRGGPEERRRFLDDAIIGVHPPYSATVSDYARALKQKNTLLQNARTREFTIEKTAELLQPWNDQIAELSAKIHRSRVRIVQRLSEHLQTRLFGSEEVSLGYISSLEGKGDLDNYQQSILERMQTRVQAELVSGHALIGAHRDDLEITFDGRDLRKYGSAGQQRSSMLLLLLANIEVYNATRGEYPLFLLDDIDSELDHKRIGILLEYLSGKTQTIVTTSKESFVDEFGASASIFEIQNGTPKPR